MGRISLVVFVNVLLAGFSHPALAQAGGTGVTELEPYPGSVRFCGGHVSGAPQPGGTLGPHITWDSYYSTDPPPAVVDHYTNMLGSESHSSDDGRDIWRFPLESPIRVLSVVPATSRGPWTGSDCDPAPDSARTIVLISLMARPN